MAERGPARDLDQPKPARRPRRAMGSFRNLRQKKRAEEAVRVELPPGIQTRSRASLRTTYLVRRPAGLLLAVTLGGASIGLGSQVWAIAERLSASPKPVAQEMVATAAAPEDNVRQWIEARRAPNPRPALGRSAWEILFTPVVVDARLQEPLAPSQDGDGAPTGMDLAGTVGSAEGMVSRQYRFSGAEWPGLRLASGLGLPGMMPEDIFGYGVLANPGLMRATLPGLRGVGQSTLRPTSWTPPPKTWAHPKSAVPRPVKIERRPV